MTESKQPHGGRAGAFFGRLWGFVKRHKKLFIFLVVVFAVATVALIVFGNLRTAAASFTQAPQTTTLARMDLKQIVSGTGTLKSSATREVTSSLSYDIVAIYVAEGDKVEAGQPLAQLDTTDLDADIADVQKSISEAEASDALALSQAQRKLQEATDQYSIDEARLNSEISKAESTLSSANSTKSTAAATRTAKKAAWDTAKAALDADTGADPAEHDRLVQAEAAAKTDYETADKDYQTAKTAADQAQTAYDNAVQQKDTTLRQDNISIENARDSVNNQKLKDSASTYRTQLEGFLEDKENCLIEAPVAGTVTAMTAEVGASAGGGMSVNDTATASASLFTIEDVDNLEITSSIPEYDATTLSVGMSVDITSDALDNEAWTGRVKSISAKADDSGNFTVVVEVTSPAGELAIGMSAKINIITDAKNNVFAVPYDAVTTNAEGQSVIYVYGEAAFGNGGNMPSGGGTPPEGFTPTGNFTPPDGAAETGEGAGPAGTPLVVETGMETDYYIEISGEGLEEGLVILADPEGKNVSTDTGMGGFMMGGGF